MANRKLFGKLSLLAVLWLVSPAYGHESNDHDMVDKHKDQDGYFSYTDFQGISIRVANWVPLYQLELERPISLKTENVEIVSDLINHITKCSEDSKTFRNILEEVALQSHRYNSPLKIHAVRGRNHIAGFAGLSKGLDGFVVDLNDLEILPNPLRKSGSGSEFENYVGHPPWAEFLCSALGHELSEFAARRKSYLTAIAKKQKYNLAADRINHHYRVANSVSDKISKDYFVSSRERGADCNRKHGDHQDTVIEIKPNNAILIHHSPDRVSYEPIIEERYGKIFQKHSEIEIAEKKKQPGSWAYVTYETEFKFPNVSSTNSCSDF